MLETTVPSSFAVPARASLVVALPGPASSAASVTSHAMTCQRLMSLYMAPLASNTFQGANGVFRPRTRAGAPCPSPYDTNTHNSNNHDTNSLTSASHQLDFFSSPLDGMVNRSPSGGFFTLLCLLVSTCLLVNELYQFALVDVHESMSLAPANKGHPIPIRVHITFPYISCNDISVDYANTKSDDKVQKRQRPMVLRKVAGWEAKVSEWWLIGRFGAQAKVFVWD